jgi:hypothetical protein
VRTEFESESWIRREQGGVLAKSFGFEFLWINFVVHHRDRYSLTSSIKANRPQGRHRKAAGRIAWRGDSRAAERVHRVVPDRDGLNPRSGEEEGATFCFSRIPVTDGMTTSAAPAAGNS